MKKMLIMFLSLPFATSKGMRTLPLIDEILPKDKTYFGIIPEDLRMNLYNYIIHDKLKEGANPNVLVPNGITFLLHAINQQQLEVVSQLLAFKADPNEGGREAEDGLTPLHLAIFKRHYQIVISLLGCPSIDVNKRMKNGVTPLYLAASSGDLKIVTVFGWCRC